MATFVEIQPDAFNEVFSDVAIRDNLSSVGSGSFSLANTKKGQYHHVRRPVRGIQIKDETYATIQVRQSNGLAIKLFDAGATETTGYKNSNFLIQSINETRAEKHQIILTFGEPYIFFFGEQPRIINVTGVLLNTEDFNWRAEWWANYDNMLRGTQCVRTKTRVYLSWDDIVTEGYILQCSAVEDASNNNIVQFTFQMFLTNYQNISRIDDANAHWKGKVINLDPSTIDLPGQGGLSSTANVREANLQQQIASSQNSNSLFEFLRSGPLSTIASASVTLLSGQITNILSLASQFISGRNVRVPIGFTGAAAFDQEIQLALSSIPGSLNVINGTQSGRVLSLQTPVSGLVTEFTATLGSKFGPANVGKPLSDNADEYIAREQEDSNIGREFNNLFNDQLVEDDKAMTRVRQIFDKFGLLSGDFSSITSLVKNVQFGVVSVGGAGVINVAKSLL
jgi:hypothetical protein